MITLRSFLIGIICVVAICAVTPYSNHYVDGAYLSSNHLPLGPLFIITILVFVVNSILIRISPKAILSQTELVTIWSMMVLAVSIPSKSFAEYLLPDLVAPYYLATAENEWQDLFHQYIPSWLVPNGNKAIFYFYRGSPVKSIPWRAWEKPLLAWSIYALGLYGMMYCLSVILRKQWIEHEKLTFPLVKLPSEIMKNPEGRSALNSFLKNHGLWIGFAISSLIHIFNGFNANFPHVPRIPMQFSLDPLLTEKPWNAILPLPITIQPSVIGVSYLLTLRVSFSVWFFYLFYKFECFIAELFGFHTPNSPGEFGFTKSFASHQEMGAFVVVTIFLLWKAKGHLKEITKSIFSKMNNPDEPLSYRWALIGLVFSIVLQVILSQFMGMTFGIAVFIALAFGVMSLIFTWQVSSAGILRVDSTFDPMMTLLTILGGRRIGPANFTIDSIQARGFRTDISQLPMPTMMSVFKIYDDLKANKKWISLCFVVTVLIALPLSSYFFLSLSYKYGGENLSSWNYRYGPQSAYNALVNRITNPPDPNWSDIGFIFVGGIFTAFIMFMYHRFLWWPFHPIGCTTGSSWGIQQMLFSIFLGWLFKYFIVKYGGLKGYRSAYPIFLGLIFGEYTMGGIWFVIGLFTGKGYKVLPT